MFKTQIALAVNVHNESIPQLTACLSRIDRNLPFARRTLFLNGESRKDVRNLAEQFGFSVVIGKNLGTNRTWHLWWLRMLNHFDRSGAEICFKFDPDTMVDRTPIELPKADYFGHVHYGRYGFPFIQGGITGLSINVVRAIIRGKLLDCSQDKLWFFHPLRRQTNLADDQLLALALQHLGVSPVPWPECRSLWRRPIPNESAEFSIVHPRYFQESD